MRLLAIGPGLTGVQCRARDGRLQLEMFASRVVAVEASRAAKGRETDPRRLASEVGPSETGRCMSGTGEPGQQTKPTMAPRPCSWEMG